MKTLLAIGASALALGLASAGGAQAQSLSAVIGADLINLQATFTNGNWANQAVNIGAINGAVVLGQAGLETINNVDLPNLNVNVEGAAGAGLSIVPPLLSVAGAAELQVGLDLGAASSTIRTIGGIDSTDEISTTVVGAVNTGDIASAVSSTANRATSQVTASAGSASSSTRTATEAAANTSNTASSAAASQVASLEIVGPSSSITNSVEALTSGPLADVYASNLAYNVGLINGSVAAIANDMNLDGISTTVVGAVNTGSISMGFDGSAFQDLGATVAAAAPN